MVLEDSIIQKLDAIFEKYKCFQEQDEEQPIHGARIKPFTKGTKKVHVPKGKERFPRQLTEARMTKLDANQRLQREVTALMNKLSTANQHRICDKIISIVDDESTANKVIPEILKSIASNSLYTDLLSRVLKRLTEKGIDVESYIRGWIKSHVSPIFDNHYILQGLSCDLHVQDQYDEFCNQQKVKCSFVHSLKLCRAFMEHKVAQEAIKQVYNAAIDAMHRYSDADTEFNTIIEILRASSFIDDAKLLVICKELMVDDKLSQRNKLLLTNHLRR